MSSLFKAKNRKINSISIILESSSLSPYKIRHLSCLLTTNKRVFIESQEVSLTAKEFAVLELLALNPDKVYGRDELLKLVWGEGYPGDARTVDVHVRRLREKIEVTPSSPKYVHTKWGEGYYFNG